MKHAKCEVCGRMGNLGWQVLTPRYDAPDSIRAGQVTLCAPCYRSWKAWFRKTECSPIAAIIWAARRARMFAGSPR